MEKSSLLEGFFILLGVLSADAWFSLLLQRSKLCISIISVNGTGREIAWEELCWEGVALKMRSYWHGFLHRAVFYRGALHRGALHEGSFYTEKLVHTEGFTHRVFYTEKLLPRKGFTHRSFYTGKSLYRVISLDTEKLAQTEAFTQRSLLHRAAFTQRSFCMEKLVHAEALTQRSLYTEELFTQRSSHTQRSF